MRRLATAIAVLGALLAPGCARPFPDARYMGTIGSTPIDFDLTTKNFERRAVFHSAEVTFEATWVEHSGKTLRIAFEPHSTEIWLEWRTHGLMSPSGEGEWRVIGENGQVTSESVSVRRAFVQERGPEPWGTEPLEAWILGAPAVRAAGRWRLEFEDGGIAVMDVEVNPLGWATATIDEPGQTYPVLYGTSLLRTHGPSLLMSGFDGGHAITIALHSAEDGTVSGFVRSAGRWSERNVTAIQGDASP